MDNPTLPSEQNEPAVVKNHGPTPGPWHVSRGELSGHVEIGVDDADDDFICTMHGVPPTDNEANARLIAAAPDMLYALQIISGIYDEANDPNSGMKFSDRLKLIRAAIAKATGAA